MKNTAFLVLLFAATIANTQSLPIDFETDIVTANFENFDGGTATVIPNPQPTGINTSGMVAQIVRDGGEIWAGSKISLISNLDFSTLNSISMKVFTTAPAGTTVKFKLEGDGATERDAQTTVSNEWETLTWDFTGVPANFNYVVFMFDFGNTGDGSETSTFLFDDVEQLFGGTQIDLPVNFEEEGVNYTVTDFGGNASTLVADPEDANNAVIQSVKTVGAATWAGTTIGTPAGFATNIPLTLENSKMTIRVWSPEANTPIRLKVEDSNDPTHTCETEVNTTTAGWQTLEFDFTNQALGTELLSIGLDMGWTYNMASIFFDFGTEGVVAGEQTYYFDDVNFGDMILGVNDNEGIEGLSISPNPSSDQWRITTEDADVVLIEVFTISGERLQSFTPNSQTTFIDASNFPAGIYISKIYTDSRTSSVRLIKL